MKKIYILCLVSLLLFSSVQLTTAVGETATISGTVTYVIGDGGVVSFPSPLPNSRIVLTSAATNLSGVSYKTYTDSMGKYKLEVPYGVYEITVSKEGFTSIVSKFINVGKDYDTVYNFQLVGTSSSEPSGEYIKEKGIVKKIDLEGGFYGIESDNNKNYFPLNLDDNYKCDGLRVKFVGQLVKEYTSIYQWGVPIKILEIEEISEVIPPPVPDNGKIQGRVVCSDEPISTAEVMAYLLPIKLQTEKVVIDCLEADFWYESVYTDLTDNNGRFGIELPPGYYQLLAKKEGYKMASAPIKVLVKENSLNDITIKLIKYEEPIIPEPQKAKLTGTIGWTAVYGEHSVPPMPLYDAIVEVYKDGVIYTKENTDFDGCYSFDLPTGVYTIRASKEEHETIEEEITLMSGQSKDLDIILPYKIPEDELLAPGFEILTLMLSLGICFILIKRRQKNE